MRSLPARTAVASSRPCKRSCKGPKPERNGIYKHPMRFVLFHSDNVSASVLLAQDASGEKPWHSGYELTGVRGEVAYSAPPIVASHYTTAHIAVMAAADAVDQRLQDVIRAADYTPAPRPLAAGHGRPCKRLARKSAG